MNANHLRPLLAFSALVAVASVIIGTGLHAGARDVTVSAGTSSPVRSNGAPELVLGGVLRPETANVFAHPLSPDLWSPAAARDRHWRARWKSLRP